MRSEPTEAQKAAGNYKKGHRRVDGYNISIENAKGRVRRGIDADAKPLIRYHGTPNDVELSDLEMGHTRAGGDEVARYNGDGISFTPNRDVAVDYASDNGGQGKVFEVNVTLKKPYDTLGVANFTPEEAAEFTASLQFKGQLSYARCCLPSVQQRTLCIQTNSRTPRAGST